MTTFNELVADVYTITNRPDLVAETALAVKSATLALHKKDFFYKDLLEVALQFDSAEYLQMIAYKELFPRYRALKYLRKYDPNNTSSADAQNGTFFDVISPDQVLDLYAVNRTDVVYVAGSVMQVRSSTQVEYALIGIYQSPVVATPETYSSWIADEAQYSVVHMAAAHVFGNVLGDSSKQTINITTAMTEFADTWKSNILALGE